MNVIIILIIASIFVAGFFLVLFLWAVKSGQYDDSYTPSVRILFDEKKQTKKSYSDNESNIDKEHHTIGGADKRDQSTNISVNKEQHT